MDRNKESLAQVYKIVRHKRPINIATPQNSIKPLNVHNVVKQTPTKLTLNTPKSVTKPIVVQNTLVNQAAPDNLRIPLFNTTFDVPRVLNFDSNIQSCLKNIISSRENEKLNSSKSLRIKRTSMDTPIKVLDPSNLSKLQGTAIVRNQVVHYNTVTHGHPSMKLPLKSSPVPILNPPDANNAPRVSSLSIRKISNPNTATKEAVADKNITTSLSVGFVKNPIDSTARPNVPLEQVKRPVPQKIVLQHLVRERVLMPTESNINKIETTSSGVECVKNTVESKIVHANVPPKGDKRTIQVLPHLVHKQGLSTELENNKVDTISIAQFAKNTIGNIMVCESVPPERAKCIISHQTAPPQLVHKPDLSPTQLDKNKMDSISVAEFANDIIENTMVCENVSPDKCVISHQTALSQLAHKRALSLTESEIDKIEVCRSNMESTEAANILVSLSNNVESPANQHSIESSSPEDQKLIKGAQMASELHSSDNRQELNVRKDLKYNTRAQEVSIEAEPIEEEDTKDFVDLFDSENPDSVESVDGLKKCIGIKNYNVILTALCGIRDIRMKANALEALFSNTKEYKSTHTQTFVELEVEAKKIHVEKQIKSSSTQTNLAKKSKITQTDPLPAERQLTEKDSTDLTPVKEVKEDRKRNAVCQLTTPSRVTNAKNNQILEMDFSKASAPNYKSILEYNENGLLEIHLAVLSRNVLAVRKCGEALCSVGYSIDQRSQPDGQTALHMALVVGCGADILLELLRLGASALLPDGHGEPPVFLAVKPRTARKGAPAAAPPPLLQLLAAAQPHVLELACRQTDSGGYTALMQCARNGWPDQLALLLDHTPPFTLTQRHAPTRKTALEMAQEALAGQSETGESREALQRCVNLLKNAIQPPEAGAASSSSVNPIKQYGISGVKREVGMIYSPVSDDESVAMDCTVTTVSPYNVKIDFSPNKTGNTSLAESIGLETTQKSNNKTLKTSVNKDKSSMQEVVTPARNNKSKNINVKKRKSKIRGSNTKKRICKDVQGTRRKVTLDELMWKDKIVDENVAITPSDVINVVNKMEEFDSICEDKSIKRNGMKKLKGPTSKRTGKTVNEENRSKDCALVRVNFQSVSYSTPLKEILRDRFIQPRVMLSRILNRSVRDVFAEERNGDVASRNDDAVEAKDQNNSDVGVSLTLTYDQSSSAESLNGDSIVSPTPQSEELVTSTTEIAEKTIVEETNCSDVCSRKRKYGMMTPLQNKWKIKLKLSSDEFNKVNKNHGKRDLPDSLTSFSKPGPIKKRRYSLGSIEHDLEIINKAVQMQEKPPPVLTYLHLCPN